MPTQLAGVSIVQAKEVLHFMEQGRTVFIDARKNDDFNHGTIPGAIHCRVTSGLPLLTDVEVQKTIADFQRCRKVMVKKRHLKVVIFCNGKYCWRSTKGALALMKIGFQRVFWYRLGMNDWKSQGFPME
ncbi:rhodanese-like domain-containing protein [Magnetococcales bacterium HHB-1]